jgi:hypothetical protein
MLNKILVAKKCLDKGLRDVIRSHLRRTEYAYEIAV